MAALSVQPLPVGGLQPTYAAAAPGGDTAPVGDRLLLHVVNGSGAPVTVTVATPGTVRGLAIADATLAVAAGENGFVPLNQVYRSPADGRAAITYSAATSVEVAVLQLP